MTRRSDDTDADSDTALDTDSDLDADSDLDTGTERRRWLPGVLIGLATVLAMVSAATTWTRTQALDTDEWVEVSSELLDEPEVRERLAVYLTDQLFETVDVPAVLEARLPDALSRLAAPIAGALRGPATEGVERILASDRFGQLWATANRLAHERLVAILREEPIRNVSTADGTVTLELGTALVAVGEGIGLPAAVLDRIPPDAARITILESDDLADAQAAVRVLDFLSWFLFVVVVVLYAAAVRLSRDRPRTLRTVGLALAAGGIALLLARRVGVRTAVDQVVAEAANEPIATIVGLTATGLLAQIAWTGVVYGLLIAAFAALIGTHRWALTVRRQLARVADSTGAVVAGTAVLVLVLLWWSPGRAFERWVTALTLVGLVVGAAVALVAVLRHDAAATTVTVDSGAGER